MRTYLVASIALLVLSGCSDPDSTDDPSTEQAASKKADAPAKNDTTATTTAPPPPAQVASNTTACDITGTYQPVSAQILANGCDVPDEKTPFVVVKAENGKWLLTDGDVKSLGTLDATTCTLHIERHNPVSDGGAVADITADYHFTATKSYTAELSLAIKGAGTNDCESKLTESGSKN